MNASVADGTTKDFGAPRARKDQLHEQLQRSGLPRAVGPEEPEHLALTNAERQRVERDVRTRAPEADRVVLR